MVRPRLSPQARRKDPLRCLRCFLAFSVTVQQLGRTAFVVVYINPLQAQEGAAIDGLRHHIDARCTAALGRPVRSEVILTVRPPIHRLDPTQRAAP